MRAVDPLLYQTPGQTQAYSLCWMIALSLAAPLSAQGADRISPIVSYSTAYDDNVLGLPDQQAAMAQTGSSAMSDVVRTLQIGLQLEKTIGRQQFSADLRGSQVDYDRYAELDYQGRDLTAAWNWQVGNHLSGTASTKYVRGLMSFDDFHALERRIQTAHTHHVDIRGRIHPRWEVVAAGSNTRISYDTEQLQARSRKESAGELGLDYLTPSGNNVGLVARRITGSYPSTIDLSQFPFADDFKQDELRLRGSWNATGKIQAQFNGGHVSRRHRVFGARDFSGANARLDLAMAVSGKSSVNVSVWRELGIVDDLVAYSVNKGVSVAYTWALTSTLRSDLALQRESRDFPPSQAFGPGSAYGDTIRSARWSVDYRPGERWLMRASVIRKLKDGQGPLAAFSRNGAGVTLQYRFSQ